MCVGIRQPRVGHSRPLPMSERAQVCLTFDVDGETPGRYASGDSEHRQLSVESWGRYGVVRGLPRILSLLAELDVRATFFVPGATVDAHPAAIRAIAQAGHEVGHHGYYHLRPHRISEADQRSELERGTTAIERCIGSTPVGYRSPAWELTPETLALVHEAGFLYDSSLMGDDRPYYEPVGDGRILELPVHWALDDFFYYGAHARGFGPGLDPAVVFGMWRREIASAIAEQRATTLTFHPEVTGHSWAFEPFAAFVRELHADPEVALSPCVEVARAVSRT